MDRERREASANPRPGEGVDRTAIRQMLALTPAERLRLAVEEARNLASFDARIRK